MYKRFSRFCKKRFKKDQEFSYMHTTRKGRDIKKLLRFLHWQNCPYITNYGNCVDKSMSGNGWWIDFGCNKKCNHIKNYDIKMSYGNRNKK